MRLINVICFPVHRNTKCSRDPDVKTLAEGSKGPFPNSIEYSASYHAADGNSDDDSESQHIADRKSKEGSKSDHSSDGKSDKGSKSPHTADGQPDEGSKSYQTNERKSGPGSESHNTAGEKLGESFDKSHTTNITPNENSTSNVENVLKPGQRQPKKSANWQKTELESKSKTPENKTTTFADKRTKSFNKPLLRDGHSISGSTW